MNLVDPFGLEKTTGNCAIGAYDCLIYGLNNPEMRNFGEQLLGITPGDLVEKLWVCSRRINALYGWFFPNHKYVCCDGVNQNCYGHQANGLMPKDRIPPELRPDGQCELREVTSQNRKAHCDTPKSPCYAGTFTWNCRNWAEWDGEAECPWLAR
ncbi:MAG: hypothetical protein BWK78_08855 [Thiotrichaceae bacterium IS1]|nr:MAG: hypothetical protein BWK78_08855 [Thiotrichaceae bacterium IS1]